MIVRVTRILGKKIPPDLSAKGLEVSEGLKVLIETVGVAHLSHLGL